MLLLTFCLAFDIAPKSEYLGWNQGLDTSLLQVSRCWGPLMQQ